VWHLDKETGGHYAKLDCIVFLGFLLLADGDLLLVLLGSNIIASLEWSCTHDLALHIGPSGMMPFRVYSREPEKYRVNLASKLVLMI
jgi:hypothetical protein